MNPTPQKTIQPHHIPKQLKLYSQWVLWKKAKRGKEITKLPFQVNHQAAKSNDPSTWNTLEAILAHVNDYEGPGFMFSPDDSFVGIDLDGCRNPQTGEFTEWAREIINQFDSYVEMSPSQTGVKIFTMGNWPFDSGKKCSVAAESVSDKRPGIEVYAQKRYFTVTGWKLQGRPENVAECQDALGWLAAKYFHEEPSSASAKPNKTGNSRGFADADRDDSSNFASIPPDEDVLDRARKHLARLPPAVSGQRGHDGTFHAACVLTHGFALPEADALTLLSDWNQSCKPPWTDKELSHKIQSAMKEPGKRGYLLEGPHFQVPPAPYEPFPVEVLPEPVRGFVASGSQVIGCDPAFIAMPLLTMLGATIGNSRRLRLKRTWHAPPILWTAVVGESGTAKTPAFTLALKPIEEIQRIAFDQYREALAEHETELTWHEKRMNEWKRDKKTMEDPPTPPEPPTPTRYVVKDTTIEALAPIFEANPRGLLLACDELAGWLGSFDKYNNGKGADSAQWLSMFSGLAITVDRRGSGNKPPIYVPMASVCISGGIQPGILQRALGVEHRESGMAARLLVASPPRKPKKWTEVEIHDSLEESIKRVVEKLLTLSLMEDENGKSHPGLIGLTPEAKQSFVRYYNSHNEEQVTLIGDLAAAWSKLEEYAARLALIFHFVRWAAQDTTLQFPEMLDAESMKAGIALTEWFKREAKRVYAILEEKETERDQRRLMEWLRNQPKDVTARDVAKGCRWIGNSTTGETYLKQLVKSGVGMWSEIESTSKGGRPTRRFSLFEASASAKPTVGSVLSSFADADNPPDQENTSPDPDQWEMEI